jgi:hypothetical protein
VLVSLILIPLFMAILQLGLALFVRNTLAACAQEGARYAAAEDIVVQGDEAMVSAGITQATDCVHDSLPGGFGQNVSASVPTITDAAGVPVQVVEVQISSAVPVIGMFGLGPQALHVKGDAMQEQP